MGEVTNSLDPATQPNAERKATWAKWAIFALIAAVAVSVLFVCCKPITRADISGVYVRAKDGVSDKIVLAPNGSFQQTVTFTDSRSWKTSGSWKFNGAYAEFDQLYEAFELNPDANKVDAIVTIPPQLLTDMFLEVQKGKLLRNTVEPIWIKQQSENSPKP